MGDRLAIHTILFRNNYISVALDWNWSEITIVWTFKIISVWKTHSCRNLMGKKTCFLCILLPKNVCGIPDQEIYQLPPTCSCWFSHAYNVALCFLHMNASKLYHHIIEWQSSEYWEFCFYYFFKNKSATGINEENVISFYAS